MKSENKTNGTAAARTPTYEEISRRAYELWEKDGRPEGSEQRHWFEAERELSRGRGEPAPGASSANPKSAAASGAGPSGTAGRRAAGARV